MALEPINKFSYTRDWTKPADFPTFEDDEQTVREDMQYQPNELKQFINEALVSFINDSLIPLVDALVAGTIPANSVYTAAIQNGAVTLAKLGADVTAVSLGALAKVNGVAPDDTGNVTIYGGDVAMSGTDSTTVAGAVNAKQPLTSVLTLLQNWQMIVTGAANAFFPLNFSGTDYRVSLMALKQVFSAMLLGSKSIGTALLQDGAVTTIKIHEDAVTSEKIADKTITAANIADGAITAALLAAGVVTAEKLSDDIPYTKFGLAADQVRKITAGTADPTGGNDGDIYIQYSE